MSAGYIRALDIRTNIDDFLKKVDQARLDQVPQAMSWALNWSIEDAKVAVQEEMRRVFDRPTDFTINSPQTHWSRKQDDPMVAWVTIKDWGSTEGGTVEIQSNTRVNKGTPAAAYLKPQIEGGGRGEKRFEFWLRSSGYLPSGWFAVPAREAPLDAYGNVPRGFLVRMMTDLRSFTGEKSGLNRKPGRRKGAKATNAFFAVKPGGPKQTAHLKPGIYWRLPGRMLVCVFVFVTKVQYQKRLDFQGVAERAAVEAFQRHWPNAWARALATDRRNDIGRLIKLAA